MITIIAATTTAVGDPLYNRGIGTFAHPSLIFITLLKAVLVVVAAIVMAAIVGLFEARRNGGVAATAAFAVSGSTDRKWLGWAPLAAVVLALLAAAVIPFGGVVHVFGHDTRMQLADPGAGVLVAFDAWAIAGFALVLTGWASSDVDRQHASADQALRAIAGLGLVVLAGASATGVAGALQTSVIAAAQQEPLWSTAPNWLHGWNVLATAAVPLALFFIGAGAVVRSMPIANELTGVRSSLAAFAARVNHAVMVALGVTLFLGGGDGPTFSFLADAWWSLLWFVVKFVIITAIVATLVRRAPSNDLRRSSWVFAFAVPVTLGWTVSVLAWRIEHAYAFLAAAVMSIVTLFFLLAGEAAKDRREDDAFEQRFAAEAVVE